MKRALLRAAALRSSGMRYVPPLAAASVLVCALALAAAGHSAQRLAMLLLLAPLLEETVFRAGLQEALLRRWHSRPYLANAVTAVAFGLAHAAVRADGAAVAAALPALLIGVVYQCTGRLRYCVVLHAAMNAAWLTAAALLGYR